MSITLAELESRGVLVGFKLRKEYGEEAVSFSASGAAERMGGAVAIRLGALLSREDQIDLLVAWVSRAMGSDDVGWASQVASLLTSPSESAAQAFLVERQAEVPASPIAGKTTVELKESPPADLEPEVVRSGILAGLGISMARLAQAYAQSATGAPLVGAFCAAVSSCVAGIASAESMDYSPTRTALGGEVLVKLDQNGVAPSA